MRIHGFGHFGVIAARSVRSAASLTRRVLHHARRPALHIHAAGVKRRMPNVTSAAAFGPRPSVTVRLINLRACKVGSPDPRPIRENALPDVFNEPGTHDPRPIHVSVPGASMGPTVAGADNGRTTSSPTIVNSSPYGQADVRGSVIDILA